MAGCKATVTAQNKSFFMQPRSVGVRALIATAWKNHAPACTPVQLAQKKMTTCENLNSLSCSPPKTTPGCNFSALPLQAVGFNTLSNAKQSERDFFSQMFTDRAETFRKCSHSYSRILCQAVLKNSLLTLIYGQISTILQKSTKIPAAALY